MKKYLWLLLIFCSVSFASTTRTIEADQIKSSDKTKTWSLPSTTDSLMGSSGIVQEEVSGTVNGSNVTFTVSNSIPKVGTLLLYLDGLILIQGSGKDYTISGNTITMATAPAYGQSLYAIYSKY